MSSLLLYEDKIPIIYFYMKTQILKEVVDRPNQQIEGDTVGLKIKVEFGPHYVDIYILYTYVSIKVSMYIPKNY